MKRRSRSKRLVRKSRKALRSREAWLGIIAGLIVCAAAIALFISMHAIVIEVGNRVVVTSAKKQQALRTATIPATAVVQSKPYGVALGATLEGLNQSQLNSELSALNTLGVNWIRIDIAWPDVQPTNATSYNWSMVDPVVKAAHAHHLNILATLAYTPSWAAVAGCNDASQKCAPESDAQFAAYATAVVQRYKGDGVNAWEIWNEENNLGFWMPAPNPTGYTQLLAASYAAIKKVEPQSTVLVGGLGPLDGSSSSLEPTTFLSDLYAAGAAKDFDAVGFHPYSYPALPSTVASWSGWSMLDDLPTSMRSVMVANGDGNKKLWITEYGAPTGGPGETETTANYGSVGGDDHLDQQLQAESLTQSAAIYEADSWLGNYFWYSYKDLGTDPTNTGDFFGLVSATGTPKQSYSSFLQIIKANR